MTTTQSPEESYSATPYGVGYATTAVTLDSETTIYYVHLTDVDGWTSSAGFALRTKSGYAFGYYRTGTDPFARAPIASNSAYSPSITLERVLDEIVTSYVATLR